VEAKRIQITIMMGILAVFVYEFLNSVGVFDFSVLKRIFLVHGLID
jgi:hypothetical protein